MSTMERILRLMQEKKASDEMECEENCTDHKNVLSCEEGNA